MPDPRDATRLLIVLLLAGLGAVFGVRPGGAEGAAKPGSTETDGAPVTVSPGSAAGSRIGDGCPTFSWGAVAGAEKYELVVDLLGADMEETKPKLLATVPGSASSWTPSLDRCLEPGRRYAWSVRAVDREKTSDWSSARIFQVASGPSEAEFERALEVVRQYLESRGPTEGVDAEEISNEVIVSASTEAPEAPTTGKMPAPEPLAPAGTQMSVDGNVDAVSFSGSATQLTGLNPDPPCFSPTKRFVDCGNGTVTDGVTGLVYLKEADCYGSQNWAAANVIANLLLQDGSCGLTDGSRPGDWRLATNDEWLTILNPGCAFPAIDSDAGCYADAPWASSPFPLFSYWSSSTGGSTDRAWLALTNTGTTTDTGNKTTSLLLMWPVRGGR